MCFTRRISKGASSNALIVAASSNKEPLTLLQVLSALERWLWFPHRLQVFGFIALAETVGFSSYLPDAHILKHRFSRSAKVYVCILNSHGLCIEQEPPTWRQDRFTAPKSPPSPASLSTSSHMRLPT